MPLTVRPPVHTNPSRKRCFSSRRNLKTPALPFSVDRKHFESGAFRKRWRHNNHVISLPEFSSKTNSKWPVIVVFLNSSGVVRTENNLCALRVKLPFLNSSGVVRTENNLCALRVKLPFLNSSGVVRTENNLCALRVKLPFLNSSGVVRTENNLCALRVKLPFLNSSGVVRTENKLMRSPSETSVFKFLWRRVKGYLKRFYYQARAVRVVTYIFTQCLDWQFLDAKKLATFDSAENTRPPKREQ